MTTPDDHDPRIETFAAWVKESVRERTTAYGPRPQPSRVKAWKPKSVKQQKKELHEQRARLQVSGRRRFAAGLAPGRTASAAPPPAATHAPCPGCGTPPHGCGDRCTPELITG